MFTRRRAIGLSRLAALAVPFKFSPVVAAEPQTTTNTPRPRLLSQDGRPSPSVPLQDADPRFPNVNWARGDEARAEWTWAAQLIDNPQAVPNNLGRYFVQIPGVSVGYARFMQEIYDLSVDQYYHRITFEIPYSPLIGQWLEMREVFGNLRDPASRAGISQIVLEGDAEMSEGQAVEMLAVNLPDFWFVYLHFVRGSR